MEQKKKFPMFSIIMIVVGVCLIIFGIIAPGLIFGKSKDIYKVEMDHGGFDNIEAKIELNTDKEINTSIVVFVVDEEYNLIVKEIEDGVYKGTLELDRDEHFFTDAEDVIIKVKSINGEAITFEPYSVFGDATNSGGRIAVTVLAIFFGIVISIVGLMLGIAIKNSSNIKRAVGSTMSAVTGVVSGAVSTVADVINPSRVQKHCEYCHADNDHNAVNCVQCGAPLSSKK